MICHFFDTMSKRRKGFPSESRVKRGVRIVHGDKELEEKIGRNDLCPCGSAKLFRWLGNPTDNDCKFNLGLSGKSSVGLPRHPWV
jgi:hypothetical protein